MLQLELVLDMSMKRIKFLSFCGIVVYNSVFEKKKTIYEIKFLVLDMF
jgi:hypothetical protein